MQNHLLERRARRAEQVVQLRLEFLERATGAPSSNCSEPIPPVADDRTVTMSVANLSGGSSVTLGSLVVADPGLAVACGGGIRKAIKPLERRGPEGQDEERQKLEGHVEHGRQIQLDLTLKMLFLFAARTYVRRPACSSHDTGICEIQMTGTS